MPGQNSSHQLTVKRWLTVLNTTQPIVCYLTKPKQSISNTSPHNQDFTYLQLGEVLPARQLSLRQIQYKIKTHFIKLHIITLSNSVTIHINTCFNFKFLFIFHEYTPQAHASDFSHL